MINHQSKQNIHSFVVDFGYMFQIS